MIIIASRRVISTIARARQKALISLGLRLAHLSEVIGAVGIALERAEVKGVGFACQGRPC